MQYWGTTLNYFLCHFIGLVLSFIHELLQSTYKQGHSTETTLVKVQNDILRSIDERNCVALLLLNLSAAFDTVDHSILLSRLCHRFGIDGKALKWLHSYLTDRSQFVCVGNGYSSRRDLLYGVPQGSVLGLILYLLYTAPLADVIKEHNMSYHFYADDTQIYMSFHPSSYMVTLDEIRSKIEACVSDISEWMTDNKLQLNNDKTELLILHAYHRPSPSLDSVYADTELIKASESVRNIGVWFDKTLLMKKHVNSVCKTAFYQLRHLATIRRFLSYQHFEILIHAFVTSRLDYCNSLLSGLPQNSFKNFNMYRTLLPVY